MKEVPTRGAHSGAEWHPLATATPTAREREKERASKGGRDGGREGERGELTWTHDAMSGWVMTQSSSIKASVNHSS